MALRKTSGLMFGKSKPKSLSTRTSLRALSSEIATPGYAVA
jgi:hypothetical protein